MTIDEALEIIATRMLGYMEAPVGPDARGEHAGTVLAPVDWNERDFRYTPLGPVHRLCHVPKVHRDPVDFLWFLRELRRRRILIAFMGVFVQVRWLGPYEFFTNIIDEETDEKTALLLSVAKMYQRMARKEEP